MAGVPVRSRSGNVLLATLGAVYAVAGAMTLVSFTTDVWNRAGLMDRLFLLGLAAAVLGGVWFLVGGLQNLGFQLRRRLPH